MDATDITRFAAKNTLPVFAFDEVTSTNAVARERGKNCAVVAFSQTAGRGRKGRTFLSPVGGLYVSVSRRIETMSPEEAPTLTAFSCVAACRAIERVCGVSPQIKWVNDLYVTGKKVCGILTEATTDENGLSVTVGIGINVFSDPVALASVGGAPLLPAETPFVRERLAAALLDELASFEDDCLRKTWLSEYRRRSFLLGERIRCFVGTESFDAIAEGIDDRGGLIVTLSNGETRTLSSGEITIRRNV